jgi:Arc/MetJ-type ribon-helix-helix transcriptional regulator
MAKRIKNSFTLLEETEAKIRELMTLTFRNNMSDVIDLAVAKLYDEEMQQKQQPQPAAATANQQ